MDLSRISSPVRAAGALLVAAVISIGCGGGGGDASPPAGNTPPPAGNTTPPDTADRESPKLVSVAPSNGATGVSTTGTIVAVYDEPIACAGLSGTTVKVGTVNATVQCDSAAKQLSVVPAAALPSGTTISVTLPGVADLAGNRGADFPLAFSTEVTKDTVPPKVVSTVPAPDATGIDRGIRTLSVQLDEGARCTAATATLSGGGLSIPVTVACVDTLVTLSVGVPALFQKTAHTWTLSGVTDAAGNPLADVTGQFATAPLPMVTATRLYTANAGADPDNGRQYVSVIDFGRDYAVEHITSIGWSPAYQTMIVADVAAGKVYSSGLSTGRGIDVIDIATSKTSNIRLDPDPLTVEYIRGLAVGPAGLYVAHATANAPSLPELSNRIFRFDRLTQARLARSVPLTDDVLTPMALVVHPDPALKRIYVLSATRTALNVINFNCGMRDYQPGTVGTVTELDAETLVVLRTFSVGSVPTSGVIDRVRGRLIVGNAGDRTFSSIDLATGTVLTSARPTSFIGCRQPVDMVFDPSGGLRVSNSIDGVHTLDPVSLQETGFTLTGGLSRPYGLVVADGKLYAALWRQSDNVVEITGTVLTRFSTVGPGPVGITAFFANP